MFLLDHIKRVHIPSTKKTGLFSRFRRQGGSQQGSLMDKLQNGEIKTPLVFSLTFTNKGIDKHTAKVCFLRYTPQKDGIVCKYMLEKPLTKNKCPEGGDFDYYFEVDRTKVGQEDRNLIIDAKHP